ncbi:hypothetical protein AXF15_12940 [Desulfomicrobium orale DSM 12838]|uniref:Diguanylate cyclase n=2 Tax=Desulfomicrobium orale TaxID=132132 RepID=A0A0X8JST6_9BACT|nr:hypothetical protein AXF15_12940 [Desulfomicrobium orale DSM 12838]
MKQSDTAIMKEMDALRRWLTDGNDPDSEAEIWSGLEEHEKEALAPLRPWRLRDLEQRRLLEDKAARLEVCVCFSDLGFWTLPLDEHNPLAPETPLSCSPSCLRLLGFQDGGHVPATLSSWLNRAHPEDRETVQNELLQYVRDRTKRQDVLTLEFRLRHEDDSWHWLQIQGKILEAPDQHPRMAGVVKDVTKERQTQKNLAEQLLFQNELLKALPTPVFVKDADTRYVSINRAYEEAFGVTAEELIGKTAMALPFLSQAERVRCLQEDSRLISHGGTMHRELNFPFSDGTTRHCLYWSSCFRHAEQETQTLIGIIVDISEQKKTEKELALKVRELDLAKTNIESISRTDYLTGLPNRRSFMDRFQEAISLAGRHKQPLSLLMADLDHFKRINDTLGHCAGDKVLQDFAALLRRECRKEDLPARSGGEEFLILLPMTNLEEARHVGRRICASTQGISIENGPVTVSIGAVQYKQGEAPDAFLKRVDRALYEAKKKGRDQVCCVE